MLRRHEELNPHAERWVRSVKEECLSKLILFGEPALRTALGAYVEHFHGERNHEGKDNLLLFPTDEIQSEGVLRCRERLGGLLKFYHPGGCMSFLGSSGSCLGGHLVTPP